jgi:hypothetical protein
LKPTPAPSLGYPPGPTTTTSGARTHSSDTSRRLAGLLSARLVGWIGRQPLTCRLLGAPRHPVVCLCGLKKRRPSQVPCSRQRALARLSGLRSVAGSKQADGWLGHGFAPCSDNRGAPCGVQAGAYAPVGLLPAPGRLTVPGRSFAAHVLGLLGAPSGWRSSPEGVRTHDPPPHSASSAA